MKLMDARLFLEEKLSELEEANRQGETERNRMMKPKILERPGRRIGARRVQSWSAN
ncbi:unnamed protein product [Arabidopsis lyrata]|nr:unnamed protein product [Arabidopsis lyrata]